MKHKENTRKYVSDDGKMIVRKSDNRIMGYGIELGVDDSIDNYEEREFTDEEIAAFWESVDRDDPRRPRVEPQHPVSSH